jgi:hypothetical protein
MRVDQAVMALLRPLRHRVLLLAGSGEQGFALPTALLATTIAFSLAITAVVASVDSQQGTTRDHNSKEAIAAADAGANVALLRLNRYASALTSSTPCLKVNAGTLTTGTAEADGWCPTVTGSVGGATYSYRVTPQVTGSAMNVIATGVSGGLSRRIDVSFTGTSVGSVLANEGLIGKESVTFSGNADIRVGVGTNGTVESSGNATICNNIRHGVGKEWNHSGNASQCSGYSITEGNNALPSVSTIIPSDIETNNSDYRLIPCTSTNIPVGCQSDTYDGNWEKKPPYNSSTRSISLTDNTLTLGGGDYWLCSLTLSGNSHLIMAASAHIRLFFDTPEHCGTTEQISFTGNSNVEATGYTGEAGHFDMPGIYMLGSTTTESSVKLAGNNGTNELILYAPNTNISLSGNANYVGVLAGRTINDSGNGKISQDAGFEPPKLGGSTLYSRQSYVECTGATSSPPNANC